MTDASVNKKPAYPAGQDLLGDRANGRRPKGAQASGPPAESKD